MIAIWVKVRVKPQGRQRFLEAIEIDALGNVDERRLPPTGVVRNTAKRRAE